MIGRHNFYPVIAAEVENNLKDTMDDDLEPVVMKAVPQPCFPIVSSE